MSRTRAALGIFADLGHREGRAECLNGLAELDRAAGRLDAAERGYARAASLYEAAGAAGSAMVPRLNRGLTLCRRARWEEAEAVLAAVLPEFAGRPSLGAATLVALLAPSAAGRRPEAWDARWSSALERLKESGTVDPDIARAASRAAGLAESAGWPRRAGAAWRLARDQWAALGRTGAAVEGSVGSARAHGRRRRGGHRRC